MKNSFKDLINDKITFVGFTSSLFLWLGTSVFLLFSYATLPPFIPLYNKRPWGYDRLGSKLEISIPVLIMLVLYCINVYICIKFYAKNPLLARLIAIVTICLTLFFSILIGKIIGLVS